MRTRFRAIPFLKLVLPTILNRRVVLRVEAASRVPVIRVCVAGVTGWTGRPVGDAVEAASDLELVAGVSRTDPASYSSVAEALDAVATDVLVDYTHATAVRANVLAAVERSVNAVVGSSGLSAADYEEIDALARKRHVGVIAAGNFSLTAALLLRSAVEIARHLDAWEVIDYASAGKPDAPSGTAQELAERLEGVRPPKLGVPIGEILGAREARGATVAGTQQTVTVPSIRVRRADTTVEIPSGGSLAMAGLIQDQTKQQINGIPGIMQLPVLGALFKSRDFQNRQTELMVLVTPYIVRAVAQKDLSRPDDGFADSSDPATALTGSLNRIYGVPARPAPVGDRKTLYGFITD